MVRATRTSTAGTRRSASAVPISSPVQPSPKRRRKTIPSPPTEESDDDDSDTSIVTTITTKSTSTVTSTLSSRAPTRRGATKAASRPSSTRQSTRRTTRSTLTTAEIQPESTKSWRNKLTPAPSEVSTQSITPSVGKIGPETPGKLESESPNGNSDKENQVPALALPSLLGSVRKSGQQQYTPQPEYISPRKLDIARLAAMDTSMMQGPRNRIVITHLVLNNFKSYAGTQVIGPFHTVFFSID